VTTPATSPGAFFSFPRITDPARHADYNAWHQYDHRPENLALPGVVHGDRWVRSPDCVAAGAAPDPLLASTHYLAMYWFAEPLEASVAAWQRLGDTTLQQGRRPDLRYASRPLLGFFRPVRGYLAPTTRVSTAALPFRPHRGVHVTVTAVDAPGSAAAEEQFEWHDRERLPRVLGLPGAAGGWTFRSERLSAESTGGGTDGALPVMRIELTWLEGDPVEFAGLLAEAEREWHRDSPPPRPDAERLLLAGPLRSITPGEWDWFTER
jgi:hypothetical protein